MREHLQEDVDWTQRLATGGQAQELEQRIDLPLNQVAYLSEIHMS